ncbi:MAG: glucose 1-dehydrogenase [Actinomycetota bacterium]|nr:glucose 1-dehydrogenase [Actinomycetota bacterium]
MTGPLEGRRALVTGGATGIGRATSLRLARDGAHVVVNHVGGAQDADLVVREVRAAGGSALALAADVSHEGQVQELFRAASEAYGGPPDLLVNNAGIESCNQLLEMELADWQQILAVNLTGPFLCSREFARGLVRAGEAGVIVNVSSVHEVIPWPGFSHYCASKGGLKMFAGTIARELAPHHIRVASVAPGPILTPINQELVDDEQERAAVEAQVPLGRMGEPEEVAAAVAWLAGAEASYVTGTTLFVDGGMTLYPGVT